MPFSSVQDLELAAEILGVGGKSYFSLQLKSPAMPYAYM